MENGAVITADIVKYTQLSKPDQQKLMDTLSSFGKTTFALARIIHNQFAQSI